MQADEPCYAMHHHGAPFSVQKGKDNMGVRALAFNVAWQEAGRARVCSVRSGDTH